LRVKIDHLDKLTSEYVRKRAIKTVGGCERCLTPKYDIVKEDGSVYPAWKQLQASHFHSRRKHSVRYDPENLVALDFGCHQYFHENPREFERWFQCHIGERNYDMLQARASKTQRVDKDLTKLYLENQIRELG